MTVEIDESQRQLILLALAKLSLARPGFAHALRETAKQLEGEAMFDEFVKHGPDVQAIIT